MEFFINNFGVTLTYVTTTHDHTVKHINHTTGVVNISNSHAFDAGAEMVTIVIIIIIPNKIYTKFI